MSLLDPAVTTRKIDWVVIAGVLGNVFSTVGCVLANKYLWVNDKFEFMVTLSFFHFVFTALGCRVLLYFKFFEYKPAPFKGVLPVALGSLGSVAFMNLNLAYNRCVFVCVVQGLGVPASQRS